MSEWQPIETAPKDGAIVMGYDGGTGFPYAMLYDEAYLWRQPDWDGTYDPTHWMPLSTPPKGE